MVLRVVHQPNMERLEAEIDALNAVAAAAYQLYLARVAARAQPGSISPAQSPAAPNAQPPRWPRQSRSIRLALAYLNRLSDYLFVLARAINAGKRSALGSRRFALIPQFGSFPRAAKPH